MSCGTGCDGPEPFAARHRRDRPAHPPAGRHPDPVASSRTGHGPGLRSCHTVAIPTQCRQQTLTFLQLDACDVRVASPFAGCYFPQHQITLPGETFGVFLVAGGDPVRHSLSHSQQVYTHGMSRQKRGLYTATSGFQAIQQVPGRGYAVAEYRIASCAYPPTTAKPQETLS